MVTLQILVLPFLVRVRVAQHKKEHHICDALFLFSKCQLSTERFHLGRIMTINILHNHTAVFALGREEC